MAELVNVLPADRRLWPVDKIILGYLVFSSMLLVGWWGAIPDRAALAAAQVGAVALLLIEIKLPNPTSWFFRFWYPLPYVGACYKEMAVLVPAIRHHAADAWLASVDLRFWGAYPSVWLERIYSQALTEYLQIVYTLFVPAVLLVGFILWRQRRYGEFQYFAFLIASGYLVSYVGYLLVPALGPRFLLKPLQHMPLQGLWLFQNMQHTLNRLELGASAADRGQGTCWTGPSIRSTPTRRPSSFLARRDGRVVGRIAAILDRNTTSSRGERGFFGFFESTNDPEVAGAARQPRASGYSTAAPSAAAGPVNPSTNYECGMLIEGFDSSPMVMMTYNPRYYPALMEGAGLRKAKDLYAYLSAPSTVERRRSSGWRTGRWRRQRGRGPAHRHEGFRRRCGTGLGSVQFGMEPQLGIHSHDARGVRS
jgi:hypothetical protein